MASITLQYNPNNARAMSIIKRISELIEDICKHPFTGTGNPEPLKYELTGLWSRRITRQHCIIDEVLVNKISIISMKGDYK